MSEPELLSSGSLSSVSNDPLADSLPPIMPEHELLLNYPLAESPPPIMSEHELLLNDPLAESPPSISPLQSTGYMTILVRNVNNVNNAIGVLETTQDPINNEEKTEALKYIENLINGLWIAEGIKQELIKAVANVLNNLRALKKGDEETLKALQTAKEELNKTLKDIRKKIVNENANSVYKQLIDNISDAELNREKQNEITKKAKKSGNKKEHEKEVKKLKEAREEIEKARGILNEYKNYAKDITQIIRKGFRREHIQLPENEQLHIGRKHIEKPKRRLIDELCKKGKCGWDKRKTLDDLSRDELMLIIRWIKQAINELKETDFGHWRDLRRIYNRIKKTAPKNNKHKWTKETYKHIVNRLLNYDAIQDLDKNRFTIDSFVAYFNTQPNTEVYNKIYSRCYVYRIISIENNLTNRTTNIKEKSIDDKYTGRPGDAPVLFLTDIIRNYPDIASYIHKDLRDNNIFAKLKNETPKFRLGVYNDKAPGKERWIEETSVVETREFDIKITIQRIKRGKKEKDNELVLKANKNRCLFEYRLKGEITEEYTPPQHDEEGNELPNYRARVNYKTLKTTSLGPKHRQICKYNDIEQTPCVPLRRRERFMSDSMKKWLKHTGEKFLPIKFARRQKGVLPKKGKKEIIKTKLQKLIEEFDNGKLVKNIPPDADYYINPSIWPTMNVDSLREQVNLLVARLARRMFEEEKEKNEMRKLLMDPGTEIELDETIFRQAKAIELQNRINKKYPEDGTQEEIKETLIKQLLYLIKQIPKIIPGWDLWKLEKEAAKLMKLPGIKLQEKKIQKELEVFKVGSNILGSKKNSESLTGTSKKDNSKGKEELHEYPENNTPRPVPQKLERVVPIEQPEQPKKRKQSKSDYLSSQRRRSARLASLKNKKSSSSLVPVKKHKQSKSKQRKSVDSSQPRRRSERLAKQSNKKGGRLRKSNKRVM